MARCQGHVRQLQGVCARTFARAQALEHGLGAQRELAALHHQRQPRVDALLRLFLRPHESHPASPQRSLGHPSTQSREAIRNSKTTRGLRCAQTKLDSQLRRTDFLLTADTMAPEVYLLLSLQQQSSSAAGLQCTKGSKRRQGAADTRTPAGSRGATRGWGGLQKLEAGRRGQAASPLEQKSPASPSPKPPPTRSESRHCHCTGAGFVAGEWQRLHTMVRLLCAAAHQRRYGDGVLITPARGVCAGAQAAGE